MIFTDFPSHLSFNYSLRKPEPKNRQTCLKSWEKNNSKTPRWAGFLKSGSLCYVVAHSVPSCLAKPTVIQQRQCHPLAATHCSACPPKQPKWKQAEQREKKHNQEARIGHLEPFSVRLELIKKMNTSLGEKPVFPVVVNSGQDILMSQQISYFTPYAIFHTVLLILFHIVDFFEH